MPMNMTSTVLFLGTGAGDWQQPIENGFFRHQSCVLVDQDTLIDCPYHTLESLEYWGKKPEDISWLLITHSHGDHLCQATVDQLARRRLAAGRSPLTICAHQAVINRLQGIPAGFITLSHGQFFETDHYVITPLAAMHTPWRNNAALSDDAPKWPDLALCYRWGMDNLSQLDDHSRASTGWLDC